MKKKSLTLGKQIPSLASMDDSQRNTIAMMKTVRTYMNDNAAVWNALPAAVAAVNDLSAGIDSLNDAVQQQEDTTTGITLDKAALRDALEDRIREVGDAIYAYASTVGNNSLAAQVAVTASELDTMSEQRVDDVATRVFDGGTAELANLGPYGVTQPSSMRSIRQSRISRRRRVIRGARSAKRPALPLLSRR